MIEGWVTKAALRWRGWSVRLLFLAPLAVLLAALLRMGFAYFGATLYFATFFPAVLIVGLLAGAPAGALTILLTLPVVWWAFIPPAFVFNALKPTDYANCALFIVTGGMTICLAELYRSTVIDLLNLQNSREHLMRTRPSDRQHARRNSSDFDGDTFKSGIGGSY